MKVEKEVKKMKIFDIKDFLMSYLRTKDCTIRIDTINV